MNGITIEQAMNRLKKAMEDDPTYAYGWHSNIAISAYDSCDKGIEHDEAHRIGNDAATNFMKVCFDVKTSSNMLSNN
tara:strand:- start:180 stop:410 length:231 start_codon:yes stop_codon:yes gene_type:complete